MKALLTVGGTLLAIAGGAYWFLTKKKAEQPAMGCLESKPAEDVATKAPAAKKAKVETAAPAVSNTAKPAVTAAKKKEEFSWEKKKPDPKDYMFSNLKGQVCIKEPGSIDGQMFIIEVGESQEGKGVLHVLTLSRTARTATSTCATTPHKCRYMVSKGWSDPSEVYRRHCTAR